MKSMLRKILDVEKNARLRTAEAEEYRKRELSGLDAAEREIIDKRMADAVQKVSEIRAQLEKKQSIGRDILRELNEKNEERLDRIYADNAERWADELYAGVLGIAPGVTGNDGN